MSKENDDGAKVIIHNCIACCAICILLPLAIVFIVSYILMYNNELPDLDDKDNQTYTAWLIAFIVFFGKMVLNCLIRGWTQGCKHAHHIICLKKIMYFIMCVNAGINVYILVVTNWDLISWEWYIFFVVIDLALTLIGWLAETGNICIHGFKLSKQEARLIFEGAFGKV